MADSGADRLRRCKSLLWGGYNSGSFRRQTQEPIVEAVVPQERPWDFGTDQ